MSNLIVSLFQTCPDLAPLMYKEVQFKLTMTCKLLAEMFFPVIGNPLFPEEVPYVLSHIDPDSELLEDFLEDALLREIEYEDPEAGHYLPPQALTIRDQIVFNHMFSHGNSFSGMFHRGASWGINAATYLAGLLTRDPTDPDFPCWCRMPELQGYSYISREGIPEESRGYMKFIQENSNAQFSDDEPPRLFLCDESDYVTPKDLGCHCEEFLGLSSNLLEDECECPYRYPCWCSWDRHEMEDFLKNILYAGMPAGSALAFDSIADHIWMPAILLTFESMASQYTFPGEKALDLEDSAKVNETIPWVMPYMHNCEHARIYSMRGNLCQA